jgi:archaemetzincin
MQNQYIAFQPLGDFNVQETEQVINEVALFYHKKALVLKPMAIPQTFYHTALHQYSADSIIHLLAKLQNDTVTSIIGLTHQPIFTIKNAGKMPYYNENIFGMGYQPGNACVVSDIRFMSTDKALYAHRLKTVILHEKGHNLGLPHCNNNQCIMSEKTGDIVFMDKTGNDYCARCKNILAD